MQLTLIKLGGSLITDKDKPFTAKKAVIARLAGEIKSALRGFRGKLVIGHGSGSFGHTVAAKYKTAEGISGKRGVKGLSLTAEAAVRINRIVAEQFLKKDLPVLSFAPLSMVTAEEGRVKTIFGEQLKLALKRNLLPVVYGDVILDEKRGCCIFSAEKILGIIARQLREKYAPIRMIHCGITDGVYDGRGETIGRLDEAGFDRLSKQIKGSRSVDVTGGMAHKVEECLEMARLGVRSWIINGTRRGDLRKAILGQSVRGTVI